MPKNSKQVIHFLVLFESLKTSNSSQEKVILHMVVNINLNKAYLKLIFHILTFNQINVASH